MHAKKKLYVIQPLITSYRHELLSTLGDSYSLVVLADSAHEGKKGFAPTKGKPTYSRINTQIFKFLDGRISYQTGVLRAPYGPEDAIIVFADPRFITFWLLLLFCKIRRLKVFAHGQGNYAYPSASPLRRLMYKTICGLSYKYICYNEYVRSTMLQIGCNPVKLEAADNSIQIVAPLHPSQKDFSVNGILFIGRLRHGCRLETAVESISRLRKHYPDVELHVIGGGEEEQDFKAKFSSLAWVHFYGAIYDDWKITEISRLCRIGCYPGDAGLSVVHHFSLSLPTVVHSAIHRHMGPEPAYVQDQVNGFLYDPHDDPTASLSETLLRAWSLPITEIREIGTHAFRTYESLTSPTLGQRFVKILTDSGFTPTSNDAARIQ